MIASKITLIELIITCIINIILIAYLAKGKKKNQLQKVFICALSILVFWTIGLIMQITLSKPLHIEPIYFDYFIYIAICTIPIVVYFMGLIYENTKIEFKIPARGLIGYRTEFLTDTKGEGTMNHIFDSYEPYKGDIQARVRGTIVAFEAGKSVTYGLYNAQDKGELFIGLIDNNIIVAMVINHESNEGYQNID